MVSTLPQAPPLLDDDDDAFSCSTGETTVHISNVSEETKRRRQEEVSDETKQEILWSSV